MKIAVLGSNKEQQNLLIKTVQTMKVEIEFIFYEADVNTQSHFPASDFPLLITFNLAGFQLKTLANNIWYNLLPCRQMHIITSCDNELLSYLDMPLSISMFFFCTSEEQKRTLSTHFNNIPWLKVLDFWTQNPVQSLSNAFQDVFSECDIK